MRLPRLVGLGRALDLILTGRRIEAEECQAIGLCDRLVAPGGAEASAVALAKDLAALPQACLRSDWIATRHGILADEMAALKAEFESGLEVMRTAGLEGAAHFAAGAGRHGTAAW